MNSPSRLLRWIYPTFMKIKDKENISLWSEIKERRYVDLEKVVKDNYAVLDIEVEGWERGKDQIFMVVYVSQKQKLLWHDLPIDLEWKNGFKVEKFTTQEELGVRITNILQEEDPLWIYGHNIMGYDQLQLRKLTENYFPATDKYYPITNSTQGLKRVITKGRFTWDTFLYMFQHFNLFIDNSLETLAGFTKSINYAEQSKLVDEARKGSGEAAEILLNYCAEDGLRAEEAGNKLKERAARIAQHYRRSIDVICTTGSRTLAGDFWRRRHFLIKKTIDDGRRILQEEDNIPEWGFRVKAKKGFYQEAKVIYLTPELAGSEEIVKKMHKELLDRFYETHDSLEKYELLGVMQADINWLIQRSGEILQRERRGVSRGDLIKELSKKEEAALYCLMKYRGLNINVLDWFDKINKSFLGTERALHKYGVITEFGGLALVGKEIDVEKFERGLYGCYLGRGKAICLDKERFIANPFNSADPARFVYQGINVLNKFRTNWERKMINFMVERIFRGDNFLGIEGDYDRELKRYEQGELAEEDYIIFTKRRTYGKQQMNAVFDTIGGERKNQFEKIKSRINFIYTPETEKELTELVEECKNDYAYPYLLELLEEIKNPYPQLVELVYAGDSRRKLVPKSMAYSLDYIFYGERARDYLGGFKEILQGEKQLILGL